MGHHLRQFLKVNALRWPEPDVQDKNPDHIVVQDDCVLGLLSACAVALSLKAGLVLLGYFLMRRGSVVSEVALEDCLPIGDEVWCV